MRFPVLFSLEQCRRTRSNHLYCCSVCSLSLEYEQSCALMWVRDRVDHGESKLGELTHSVWVASYWVCVYWGEGNCNVSGVWVACEWRLTQCVYIGGKETVMWCLNLYSSLIFVCRCFCLEIRGLCWTRFDRTGFGPYGRKLLVQWT